MNFIRLSNANSIFVDLLALCGFLAQISLLHILRYNKTISILAATLSKSFSDVVNILLCIAIVTSAFVSFMYIVYGPHLFDYSTVMRAYTALFSGSMGKFDFYVVIDAMGLLGSLVLLIFLLLMMYIYLNFFVTILSEYMSALREDPKAVPKDHEVIEYLLSIVYLFFNPKKREEQHKHKMQRRARK